MARRQRLSDDQFRGLLDPPTDQRALVRYYTLSSDDLAAIQRCRGDHNKLGLALMRCYLHHPGRAMNLTGDYTSTKISTQRRNTDGMKSLRTPPDGLRKPHDVHDMFA